MKRISPQLGWEALLHLLRQRSLLSALEVMAKHLGYFFQIPLIGFHPFVVFGPEANRKVLITERQKLRWRNDDPVTELFGRGVLVVDGEEHERYRSLMEPFFHPGKLPVYEEMMRNQVERVASAWKDGEVIDMLVEGRKIALLIIMQVLCSRDVWEDLPRLWKPILKAIEYISPGAWIFWRNIPRPGFRKPLKELDNYLFGLISERRQRLEQAKSPSEVPQDVLQVLIDAGLPDTVIRDQLLTMMIAGHDTSTALLAWTFAMLGQNPQIYRKLLEELDATEKSPLLDQVIKETLRLYPPIHLGNRIVAEEIEFEEGKVPAGERLFYSIYLTHRDPKVWENPEEFRPERFAHGRKTPPMSYVPFGGGPRACVGSAFGQAEARIVLSYLLRHYAFEWLNSSYHPHMGATLEPRPGVFVRVQRKNREQK